MKTRIQALAVAAVAGLALAGCGVSVADPGPLPENCLGENPPPECENMNPPVESVTPAGPDGAVGRLER